MQHVFEQRLEGVGRGAVEVKRSRVYQRKDGTWSASYEITAESVRIPDTEGRRRAR